MLRNVCFVSISVLVTLLTFTASQVSRADSDVLAQGFLDPPPAARPAVYWVWVNGLTDARQRTYELEQLKDKGISGLYIFDVGARDTKDIVPAGPGFMGPESLKAIGHTVREATRLNLEVGIVTSSSWNCGGPWVRPEHASMGLYHSQKIVEGPMRFSEVLPFPAVPKQAPKGPDGLPVYYKNVAVLAVPEAKRLAGHQFLFELYPGGIHSIDRVVLYNSLSGDLKRRGTMDLFTKDFEVLASTTSTDVTAFKKIAGGTLKPNTKPQTFRFDPVRAKYIKLLILSGHNAKDDRVQLAEFEVYSTQGKNVVSAHHEDGSKTAAGLLHYTSAFGPEGDWAAANIHDGKKSGADGSWCSAGAPQPVIEDMDSIVDLTDSVDKKGHLEWNAPAGKWTIMRFVCANTGAPLRLPSPKSGGLSIDHFSSEATRAHFDYMIDLLRQEIGDFKNTALKQMYVCSYELSGSTWTPDFLEQFEKRRGYDMTRYLPVLSGSVVKDHKTTEQFRYDFRKTLGDLLVDAFYKTGREISNEHGLQLCAEAGGPGPPLHQVPVDALKALGALDIPRGEFWKEHNVWVVKETACAAHIYGKRIVDMESFTSWRHWQDGPFELKSIADRALCGGTNHFTFHTSAHNPPDAGMPGWVYHAGTHISPSLVWWPKAKPFIDYLSRCSFLLQEGLFVADVCYYYGDQGFNFVPPKHVDPSLGYGYDYDVTNAEVILTRMSVADGRIVLPDGMSYELLVLPDRDDMDLDVLEKIEKLVKAGATVVGRRPRTASGLTDYPQRGQKVEKLANKLWGPSDGKEVKEHRYGKGRIIHGQNLRDILDSRGMGPDFSYTSRDPDARLDFIHRRTKDADVYFVSNKKMSWEQVECTFRVSGKAPELWDPASGRMRKQLVYESVAGGTKVPLRLSPLGSVLVVFRDKTPRNHIVSIKTPKEASAIEVLPGEDSDIELRVFESGTYVLKPVRGDKIAVEVGAVPASREITGHWEVRFAKGWGAPESKIFPRLISWTDDPDDGIKYFSGIAAYHKEFELSSTQLKSGNRVFLDLGRLHFVGEVYLNGRSLGILWKPPYRVDITQTAKPGKNKLVVEVANTWSNRLVGDAKLPEDQRYCRTNMTHSLTWEAPWGKTPLLESGLLGPVRLVTAKTVTIDLP
ncbi:MAG: hypothetical protein JSW47_10760 [Phycisphaerales bacterium]|nr:MAG: hypothetical protein JSW47_10760 [Phycisphaerales bacterium]